MALGRLREEETGETLSPSGSEAELIRRRMRSARRAPGSEWRTVAAVSWCQTTVVRGAREELVGEAMVR